MTIEEKRLFEEPQNENNLRCNLEKSQAHWLTRDTIVWRIPGSQDYTYQLHFSPRGELRITNHTVTGGDSIRLAFAPEGPGEKIWAKFPHLNGSTALKLGSNELRRVPNLLKGQLAVSASDGNGNLAGVTQLQIPGVLDDLYSYNGKLGISIEHKIPILRLWAPTARSVHLHLFTSSKSRKPDQVLPMEWDRNTGVWSMSGIPGWLGMFYLYEVEVYVPNTCQVVNNLVTDPYSISLSMNSKRSQIIDLQNPDLMPRGWLRLKKPRLQVFEDIVVYELHVRDFSINDHSIPDQARGGYSAFTYKNSHAMRHLGALAKVGVTHVHLLPVFDFASVNEDKTTWASPDEDLLRSYPPDSAEQQRILAKVRDRDGFNWGYDPFHYTTPEGGYSIDPDGPQRIIEFRQMVGSLNRAGLRVVMDVVYNHTFAHGQDSRSVLDRIVPGYYHRLNSDGFVENSTCCSNTATEHAMMEKLMIDSVLTWAVEYKVDGFRFDLMGHHMLSNMTRLRQALDGLTLAKNGVDGKRICLYGESWDFGEVAGSARGANASQWNIAGTGIGAFNDRLRDAVRGGRPFGGLQEQGFITGLYTDPNATDQGNLDQQKGRLLHTTDWIRIGMAGNLKEYRLENAYGQVVSGWQIEANGHSAAYTLDPQENIIYVSAHDNETLFDAIQLKAPDSATIEDRIRMHHMGMALVMFSQGIAFFLAGEEMLRSKSLDRNSYNSGDWYNALDYTYQTNNWGIGLPPAENNEHHWPLMVPLLANPLLKPSKEHIFESVEYFKELLRIRTSSRLFRLRNEEEILNCMQFYNTGPNQIPGLIVARIVSEPLLNPEILYTQVVLLFNASKEEKTITIGELKGQSLMLHPVQAESIDRATRNSRFNPYTGTFVIPGRTTAVFVSGGALWQERLLSKLRRWYNERKK